VSNYIYKVPFFKNRRDLVGYALGGWEISGIFQYQTGTPFSVRTTQDIAGVGTGSGNQFWNQVGDNSISTGDFTPTGLVWFKTSVFTQPAAGTFGTQQRNGLRGPAFWTVFAIVLSAIKLTGDLQHWQYETFKAHRRDRSVEDAFVTFSLNPDGSIDSTGWLSASISGLAAQAGIEETIAGKRHTPRLKTLAHSLALRSVPT